MGPTFGQLKVNLSSRGFFEQVCRQQALARNQGTFSLLLRVRKPSKRHLLNETSQIALRAKQARESPSDCRAACAIPKKILNLRVSIESAQRLLSAHHI